MLEISISAKSIKMRKNKVRDFKFLPMEICISGSTSKELPRATVNTIGRAAPSIEELFCQA